MKTILLTLLFSLIQLFSFGQSAAGNYLENPIQSKVIILIVLAIVSVYTFIKWTNENNRTEP